MSLPERIPDHYADLVNLPISERRNLVPYAFQHVGQAAVLLPHPTRQP